MNIILSSIIASVHVAQPLVDLVDELISNLEDRNAELLNVDALDVSADNASQILQLDFHDNELNLPFFIMVNDKQKFISVGEDNANFGNAIGYADVNFKLVALAAAYTAKEFTASLVKRKETSKYKTTRYITRSAYEGMNHDTLVGAMDEMLRLTKTVKGSGEVGISLESLLRENTLLIDYIPSTHTLMVDGSTGKAVNAVIRAKAAHRDKELAVVFN